MRTLLAACVVLLGAGLARADVLFAINQFFDQKLWRVDTDTGSAVPISGGANVLYALAASGPESLYALTGDTGGMVQRIDVETGETTPTGVDIGDDVGAMAYRASDGDFYVVTRGFEQDPEVFSFDIETGVQTPVCVLEGAVDLVNYSSATDLLFDADDNAYAVLRFYEEDVEEESHRLYEVDLETGELTFITVISIFGKEEVRMMTARATKSDGGFWASFQFGFAQDLTFGSIDPQTFDLFDEMTIDPLEIERIKSSIFRSLVLAPAGCAADCNQDGSLNVLDFVCFQSEWQNQTAAGDCDGNGTYDVLDFVCFQSVYAEGCD